MKGINLSICVPVCNEEKTLKSAVEDLISTLSPFLQNLEIIIVDDGSNDFTPELAQQLAQKYTQIQVIHHPERLGVGVCYRDALKQAQGEYFTWFPGDHENSAQELLQCLPYLKKNVIVTSYHRGYDSRSSVRRVISYIYTWLFNKYFHLNLKYYNGLTIFPTSVLHSIPLYSNSFGIFVESMVQAIRHGCQVVELFAPLKRRTQGRSKALTFSSIISIGRDLGYILLNARRNFK